MDKKLEKLVKNSKISLDEIDTDIDEVYTKVAEFVKNSVEYDKTVLALMSWMLQVRNAKLEYEKMDNKDEKSKKNMVIEFESEGLLQQEIRE